jgi:ABC-type phosphate transport system substrate-binding protein
MRLLLLLSLLAAPLGAANVAGTDALASSLGAGLGRHFETEGLRHRIDFRGTLPALEALESGKADLAVVLQREGEALDRLPSGKRLRVFPLGAVAAYVYVHPALDMREVDLATLAGIFGAGQKADYKFWSDVPGIGFQEPILPLTSGDETHPSTTLFNGIALAGRPYRANVRLRVPAAQAAETLSARTNAILVSATPMPDGIGRLLRVSDGRDGRSKTAYSPDDTNIYNGDYPLRLPVALCVPEDKLAAHKATVAWLLSDVAASALRKAGFVPTPAPIRERLTQRLDSK